MRNHRDQEAAATGLCHCEGWWEGRPRPDAAWWEGRPRPDSDRGLETAPTRRPLLPGCAKAMAGGRAVPGPISRLDPFWATTPWMGITSLIRANANLV